MTGHRVHPPPPVLDLRHTGIAAAYLWQPDQKSARGFSPAQKLS